MSLLNVAVQLFTFLSFTLITRYYNRYREPIAEIVIYTATQSTIKEILSKTISNSL